VGIVSFGTDLVNPDFAKLADASGLFGRNVDDPGELEESLRAALAHPGPALVSVKVAKNELSFPPTIDFEQAKGFGIYLVKAMLSGKGDEILDLAESQRSSPRRSITFRKEAAPADELKKIPHPSREESPRVGNTYR
jgi:Thiamine pyrophosphate enzyme, C-terminal TPP binding domain